MQKGGFGCLWALTTKCYILYEFTIDVIKIVIIVWSGKINYQKHFFATSEKEIFYQHLKIYLLSLFSEKRLLHFR